MLLTACAHSAGSSDWKVNFGSDRQQTMSAALRDCAGERLPDLENTTAGVVDALVGDKQVDAHKSDCLKAAADHIDAVQKGFGK